ADAAGWNTISYRNLVFVWPRNNPFTGVENGGCGWDGFSGGTRVYINGDVDNNGKLYSYKLNNYSNIIQLIAHEMGHGLGLSHAATLKGDGGYKTLSDNCVRYATADWDDPMAYSNPVKEFNATNRYSLGWITVPEVATSGIYTITPLENNDSGLKAIKIPRGD